MGGLQQESYCWGKVLCFRLDFPLWWAQAHWVCFGAPRAPPLRVGAQQQIKVYLKLSGGNSRTKSGSLPDLVRELPGAARSTVVFKRISQAKIKSLCRIDHQMSAFA